LIVFPNPATNTITVTHQKASVGACLKLIGIDGKVVWVNKIEQGARQTGFGLSQISRGVYILVFENNGTSVSQKIIRM
jgi:hypothetical protein